MKKKKLFILISLGLVLISLLVVFNLKKEWFNDAERFAGVTSITKKNKIELCSNEYYDTKYDNDGLIVIDESSSRIKCSPEEEQSSFGGWSICDSKRNDIKKWDGLTCLQKIRLYWSTTLEYVKQDDLPTLAQFNNLEEIVAGDNFCRAENWSEMLGRFRKLKKIFLMCDVGEKEWDQVSKLSSLEEIDTFTTGYIDFSKIPSSVKRIKLYDKSGTVGYDNNIDVKNINSVRNLINLESFSLWADCDTGIGRCDNKDFKNLVVSIVELVPSIKKINGVEINRKNFDFIDFLQKIENGDSALFYHS